MMRGSTPVGIVAAVAAAFVLNVVVDAQGPRGRGGEASAPAAPQTAPAQPDPQAIRRALAQCTADLGAMHSKIGPLEQMQAQAQAGLLVSVEDVRAQFEKANPGKTLGPGLAVVDAPAPQTGR